jgi:hypothetical protein
MDCLTDEFVEILYLVQTKEQRNKSNIIQKNENKCSIVTRYFVDNHTNIRIQLFYFSNIVQIRDAV